MSPTQFFNVLTSALDKKRLISYIDLHPCQSSFDNCVILTFDILTLWSMHGEVLPWIISIPNLVLIAHCKLFLF